MEHWEFGVLGVIDYRRESTLCAYFDMLATLRGRTQGAVCEVGVFSGMSLAAAGLFLREHDDVRDLIGFDSFSGFPTTGPEDDPAMFEDLLKRGEISADHWERVLRNRDLLRVVGRSPSAATVSTSGSFDRTSEELVRDKLRFLDLDATLIIGPIEQTMKPDLMPDLRVAAALLDCDLYAPHAAALPWLWARLEEGGFVYLDDYYSLKFPGARLAVHRFLEGRRDAQLIQVGADEGFERWAIIKGSADSAVVRELRTQGPQVMPR